MNANLPRFVLQINYIRKSAIQSFLERSPGDPFRKALKIKSGFPELELQSRYWSAIDLRKFVQWCFTFTYFCCFFIFYY